MEMGGSSSSSETHLLKIGLKFGQKTYFEDVGLGEETKSESGLSPVSGGGSGGPPKKGRTSGLQGGIQPPRCQVEGCNLDLSDAKTYYSRHKVCGVHSKTAKVVVNGLEQRFCQQCSRFHQLPEFDNGKRSCRRRLAGHNERRRKPTSGSLLAARYGTLPSSIFETNPGSGGFLMDFSACSRGRVHWPAAATRPPVRFTNDLVTATTEKLPPVPWQSNLDNPPPYIHDAHFNGVQESNCALSLLSNHHSSASRNQNINHDYYVNPNTNPNPNTNTGSNSGSHMVHHPTGSMVQGHFAANPTTGWGYDMNEAHLGLGQGQMPHPGYAGELGLGQQVRRPFDPSADHIDWSL